MNRQITRRELLKWSALDAYAGLKGFPTARAWASPAGQLGVPFRFSYKTDIFNLNPYLHTDLITFVVQTQWFDRLISMGRDGKFKGQLANSWRFIDNRTLRFRLRRGVKFHNGEDFTAESIKFTLDYIIDPANKVNAASLFSSFESALVEDAHTIVIRTKAPDGTVQSALSLLWPLPPRYIQSAGWEEFGKKPIGTGPFKFVKWDKDVSVVLEPYPNYWAGMPKLGQVTYRPIPEDSTRMAALLNKEVDFIASVPLERTAEMERNRAVKLSTRPGQMIYLSLDTLRTEPLKSKFVRQAMNYAIDVDSIVKNLLLGKATRLNGPLFVQSPGYEPELRPFSYDPARARQLLQQAGWSNGFSFTLDVPLSFQGTQKLKEVAEAIQGDLAKVAIRANLNPLEPVEALRRLREKQQQASFWAWGSSPEAARHVHFLLHSKSRDWYYNNPEADKILERYQQTIDREARVPIGKELTRFMRDDCPWVFLYQEPDIYGMSAEVDWKANSYDFMVNLYEVSKKL